MSDKQQAKTRVDEELYKKLSQHPDSMAEILREGAKMYMGDGDKKQLKEDLKDAVDEFERANRKYKKWGDRKEDRLDEIHRLARELREFTTPEEAYEDWLAGILDKRERGEGPRLIPQAISGLDGFKKLDKYPDDVQADLKELAIQQERELTTDDFSRKPDRELKSIKNSPDTYLYESLKITDDGEIERRDRTEVEKLREERLNGDSEPATSNEQMAASNS